MASAGIVLPAALPLLDVAEIVEECVDLGDRAGAANPGAKVMTLIHGMLLGADCTEGELLPSWENDPFATNRSDPLALVEGEHRKHAVVELAIRDLKDQALAHFPSGKFTANAAWTVIAALAHNLLRWTQSIGLPGQTVRAARTLRRRLLSMPGRLTRTARAWTLHLPIRWPRSEQFTAALQQIRALPPPT